MSASRSFIGRFIGGLWSLITGLAQVVIAGFLLLLIAGLWFAARGGRTPTMEENAALVIYPTGQLVDSSDVDPAQRFFEELTGEQPTQTVLRDLTEALERGAKDDRVPLAVLKLDALWGAGLSQLQELAAAVRVFRASGKPVYAYGPLFDQGEYLVASQSDSVSLDPLGMVYLEGFGVYQNYFKDALDKLGVQMHVFRVGEYKSAVEPFERNDMSPEAREANREWLDDLWQSYGREVAQGRKLPETAVNNYAATLPASLRQADGDAARVAQDSKLVDQVETLLQFRERIAKSVGWDEQHGSFRQVHYSEYLEVLERERMLAAATAPRKTVALIVLQGEIVEGDSQPGLAGAETLSQLIGEARQDEDVAALVLRVDSPGGSVFASERIRRELQAVQSAGKPVVVSMASVAASGGYWVAMDADEIFAHDTSITGSIGIFALWPTLVEPLAKLGIHTDGVGTTPLAGSFRVDRPLEAEASLVIQTQLERNYRQFLEAVAKGRDLPVEKVAEIARGRVWSGSDALKLGLVDQIGGLKDAAAAAARLAGLDAGAYELREFKDDERVPFLQLMEMFGQTQLRGALAGLAPGFSAKPIESLARSLRWLNDPRGVYAHCFCRPSVTRQSAR